jgi:hypothetical protein
MLLCVAVRICYSSLHYLFNVEMLSTSTRVLLKPFPQKFIGQDINKLSNRCRSCSIFKLKILKVKSSFT